METIERAGRRGQKGVSSNCHAFSKGRGVRRGETGTEPQSSSPAEHLVPFHFTGDVFRSDMVSQAERSPGFLNGSRIRGMYNTRGYHFRKARRHLLQCKALDPSPVFFDSEQRRGRVGEFPMHRRFGELPNRRQIAAEQHPMPLELQPNLQQQQQSSQGGTLTSIDPLEPFPPCSRLHALNSVDPSSGGRQLAPKVSEIIAACKGPTGN